MAQDHTNQPDNTKLPLHGTLPLTDPKRRGAAGKALIVLLGTGSLGAAVVAFIIFKMMGC
jgi:hypothetical protein